MLLWGLGVGYVISGMYFGWNLGLEKGGTLGMAIATAIIIVLYVCFTFSYAELACALPKAGGAFDYARRAFGNDVGFIAGAAQVIEFVLAPPAIAFAIGAYFNLFFPQIPVLAIAVFAYLLFTALNVVGVKTAAVFELVVTLLAVGELLLFAGLTLPHFDWNNLQKDALPQGWTGIAAAVPFAIWFFLGLEGVANLAEEAVNPQRTISRGFGSALITLVVLCVLTFAGAVGVDGWRAVVYKNGTTSDSPLPLALGRLVGETGALYHLLITVGLFGLVASFHGLVLAAGRASFKMGRVGFAPAFLGRIHKRFGTPAAALLANTVVGIVALFTGRTADIITIAVFGALTLYVLSMLALLRLRKGEPALSRPYKVPLYPLLPLLALVIAVLATVAMCVFNLLLAAIYFLMLGLCFACHKLFGRRPQNENLRATEYSPIEGRQKPDVS